MNIYRLVERRALITRGAAREVAAALRREPDWIEPATGSIELDFSGIEAVTPSFIDELLSQLLSPGSAQPTTVLFKNPPSRVSEKINAIGRGRDLSIEETSSGDWQIAISSSGPVGG